MWAKELELAKQAAKRAGDFLRKREDIHVDMLEGKDMKLSSDKMSEKIIMDVLSESDFPILSEEYGFKGEKSDCCWIIDPLDGTINYFKGLDDLACVSVALWEKDRPVLGVVYRFMKDEMFYGSKGTGAFLNGHVIHPSGIKETGQAVMATGFPVKRSYSSDSLDKFIRQVQVFKKVRMLGAAAVMGTFVACGRLDAYFEDEIMLWDIAAASAIVEAAGGTVSIELLDHNKCLCKCFATKDLLEDYYAKSL